MTRSEKVARAQALRARGLKQREIAEEMGVAIPTVSTWLNDPDGSRLRARKDGYRGRCVECGGATDGSNGRDAAPERCLPCAMAHRSRESEPARREYQIARIQEWARLHGEPPASADWNPTQSRHMHDEARAERFKEGGWPWATNIIATFGTWNAAIRAAGFEPRASGGGNGNVGRRRARRAAT